MDEYILSMERDETEPEVTNHFLKISGLQREGVKFDKMRDEAQSIKREIVEKLNLKAVVVPFQNFELHSKVLRLGETDFQCNAFELMDTNHIQGGFLYVITAGDFYLDQRPIIEQLYADLWGTAYVDIGRILLEKKLKKLCSQVFPGEELSISDSFGPGFYGMETAQMANLFQKVDGSKIGVELRNGAIMVPVKSCAGIYLAVSKEFEAPGNECKDCLGNVTSCKLCTVRNTRFVG